MIKRITPAVARIQRLKGTVVRLTASAEKDIDQLVAQYEAKGRLEAIENLLGILERANMRIEFAPGAGLTTPQHYPELRRTNRRWIIEGRHWIAYRLADPPVITAVY